MESGIYRAYACRHGEEFLSSLCGVGNTDALGFKQLVVEVYLIAEIGIHISCLSPKCPVIHVEQVGSAVDIEYSGGHLVSCIVIALLVAVSCAGHYIQHVFLSHDEFYATD